MKSLSGAQKQKKQKSKIKRTDRKKTKKNKPTPHKLNTMIRMTGQISQKQANIIISEILDNNTDYKCPGIAFSRVNYNDAFHSLLNLYLSALHFRILMISHTPLSPSTVVPDMSVLTTMANIIRHMDIHELYLVDNGMVDSEVEVLSKGFHPYCGLQLISLIHQPWVSQLGSASLCSRLDIITLTTIHFKQINLGKKGIQALAKHLPQTQVESLTLMCVNMVNEELQIIAHAIRDCPRLEFISMSNNHISDIRPFTTTLSKHPRIKHIFLNDCDVTHICWQDFYKRALSFEGWGRLQFISSHNNPVDTLLTRLQIDKRLMWLQRPIHHIFFTMCTPRTIKRLGKKSVLRKTPLELIRAVYGFL